MSGISGKRAKRATARRSRGGGKKSLLRDVPDQDSDISNIQVEEPPAKKRKSTEIVNDKNDPNNVEATKANNHSYEQYANEFPINEKDVSDIIKSLVEWRVIKVKSVIKEEMLTESEQRAAQPELVPDHDNTQDSLAFTENNDSQFGDMSESTMDNIQENRTAEQNNVIKHSNTGSGAEMNISIPEDTTTKRRTRRKFAIFNKDENLFECVECKKKFEDRIKLNEHYDETHVGVKTDNAKNTPNNVKVTENKKGGSSLICDVCRRAFTRKAALEAHRSSHAEPKLPCPDCDKMFTTTLLLESHAKTHSQKRTRSRKPAAKSLR